MANLTLSVDEKLLQMARVRAVKEGTSVNEICRQALEAYAQPSTASRLARYLDLQADIDAAPVAAPAPASAPSPRENLYAQVLEERHPTLLAAPVRTRRARR